MKWLTSGFVTLVLCFLISNFAMAQQRVVIPLSNPGKPGKLTLSVIRGNITVRGYKGENVIIHFDGGQPNNETKKVTKDGLHLVSSGSGGFQVVEDHNHVKISGTSTVHSVNFDISVPRNFSLDLNAVNGNIKVNNISGEFNLNAVNGNITLRKVSGAAVVNTVNGDITVTFTTVNPAKPMSFLTVNGDINLTLPADVKACVKMKAQFGEVYTNFDMDIKHNNSKNINTGHSGIYKVSINDWIYGDINDGGPRYVLKTLHGDIYIRKG